MDCESNWHRVNRKGRVDLLIEESGGNVTFLDYAIESIHMLVFG